MSSNRATIHIFHIPYIMKIVRRQNEKFTIHNWIPTLTLLSVDAHAFIIVHIHIKHNASKKKNPVGESSTIRNKDNSINNINALDIHNIFLFTVKNFKPQLKPKIKSGKKNKEIKRIFILFIYSICVLFSQLPFGAIGLFFFLLQF